MKSNRALKILIIAMVLIQVLQVWFLWRRDFFKKTDPTLAALYIAIFSIVTLAIIGMLYSRTKNRRGPGLHPLKGPRGVDEAFRD